MVRASRPGDFFRPLCPLRFIDSAFSSAVFLCFVSGDGSMVLACKAGRAGGRATLGTLRVSVQNAATFLPRVSLYACRDEVFCVTSAGAPKQAIDAVQFIFSCCSYCCGRLPVRFIFSCAACCLRALFDARSVLCPRSGCVFCSSVFSNDICRNVC